MTRANRRRPSLWGFRGKLAVSIAISFVVLGAALVGVQLVILSQSIASTINVSVSTGTGTETAAPPTDSEVIDGSYECISTGEDADCEITIPDTATDYGQAVAADVMHSYMTWSVILLVAFAVISAVLAWALTRSPARKISDLTALAEDISEHDLSRRISMPGPRDEITELGDRIDPMLSRLETAFTSQDQFVANASHELRTPTTSVRAALEAPLSQGRVPDDLQPYIQRALRSTQRMDELITALLLIARSRRLETHQRESIDLNLLVQDALDESTPAIHARSLSLTVNAPDRPIRVEGNEEAIAITVRNLIHNAIQHNCDGGQITVTISDNPEGPSLTIGNSGLVYADTEAAQLTRPFNRGRQTRRSGTPGTGLGLTIVESIAHAHDATLGIRANKAGGLDISLQFPATRQRPYRSEER